MAWVYDSSFDFFLDGVSARSKGIIMQKEPTISDVQPKYERVTIPGRNGVLHISENAYEPRTITIPCYAVKYDSTRDNGYYSGGDGVYTTMATINAYLFTSAVRKLKIGYNNTYWKAIIINGAEIAARLKTLTPFDIEFECDPMRYNASNDAEVGL